MAGLALSYLVKLGLIIWWAMPVPAATPFSPVGAPQYSWYPDNNLDHTPLNSICVLSKMHGRTSSLFNPLDLLKAFAVTVVLKQLAQPVNKVPTKQAHDPQPDLSVTHSQTRESTQITKSINMNKSCSLTGDTVKTSGSTCQQGSE
ncbi:hypothetical protein DSO57_1014754 [Entomophthora muscae]|uniref:Uncharacterized protein n=1 Tax=Entomophthora muscae TaxID=34485 RepID=A0ACC2SU94_9FUNG|nr:hypothetical protein DSO57_1014754 [Entomophthora muscae]